TVQDGPLTT
nr:immunoglobulin heavy chain junction region [Mus musculus]